MKLDWLQGLRGIAVLLVVLTHGRYFLVGGEHGALAQTMFFPAAMGVDLFFLISGFIMVYTTHHASGPRDAALFAAKRLARIWPAYAVITLLWIVVDGRASVFFTDAQNLKTLYWSLTMRPVDATQAPFFGMVFPLGWTLAFEMYFYIVFGLSMLAGRLRWFVLAAWMVLSLLLLPWTHGGPTTDVRQFLPFRSGYMQLVSNPIVWEFAAGVVIGLLYKAERIRFPSASVAWQAVFCTTGLALWNACSGVGAFHGPAGWGWALALMLGALAIASKTVTISMPSWLVWVGTISYSMYLTHYLSQVWLMRWLERHGLRAHSWSDMLLALLLAIPLASLSHALLERGLGEWARRRLVRLVDRCIPAPVSSKRAEVIKMSKVASRSV